MIRRAPHRRTHPILCSRSLRHSVERAGDKVRLRLKLLDGESGAQRWADRFDVERAAMPAVVDELAKKLARAVDLAMVRSAVNKHANALT